MAFSEISILTENNGWEITMSKSKGRRVYSLSNFVYLINKGLPKSISGNHAHIFIYKKYAISLTNKSFLYQLFWQSLSSHAENWSK